MAEKRIPVDKQLYDAIAGNVHDSYSYEKKELNNRTNTDKKVGGVKYDTNKIPLDLLPMAALLEVGEVLKFGAEKYEPYNWAKGMSYSRLIAACLRHVFAFNQGENLDPETGKSHIAHALCCLLFLMEYETKRERFSKFDDRFDWKKQ